MFDFPIRAQITGELQDRAQLSWCRLHDQALYGPSNVFKAQDYDWPGDYEGRILLAWTKLSDLLERDSEYASEMLQHYRAHCNCQGYFGPVRTGGTVDEQQLAGHGWVLRSLAEYQILHSDAGLNDVAEKIVRNLCLPLVEALAQYPISDGERRTCGEVEGRSDRRIGSWLVSTDVGAVFILFDGLLQAAKVFDLPARPVLDAMLNLAQRLDPLAVRAQTHASLTLAHGLLRYDAVFGSPDAAALARRIYDLYRNCAVTENFANYNWFGRPEWTEPCAMVDSFMVALELFRRTDETHYLDDAHRIWFSALERAQRPNGGFGGENCLQIEDPVLYMRFYEAVNCCSMRGAEGLFERGRRTVWRKNRTLYLAIPTPGDFAFADGLKIRVHTGYPLNNQWRVEILQPGTTAVEHIQAYSVNGGWLTDPGPAEEFEDENRAIGDSGFYTVWRGPVMRGQAQDGTWQPVNALWKLTPAAAENLKLNMIFG